MEIKKINCSNTLRFIFRSNLLTEIVCISLCVYVCELVGVSVSVPVSMYIFALVGLFVLNLAVVVAPLN